MADWTRGGAGVESDVLFACWFGYDLASTAVVWRRAGETQGELMESRVSTVNFPRKKLPNGKSLHASFRAYDAKIHLVVAPSIRIWV